MRAGALAPLLLMRRAARALRGDALQASSRIDG
jgi:hypothetical protein